MLLEPQYAENIIVGVIFKGHWNWYITDKDLWFLDLNKFSKAFSDKGYDVSIEDDESERYGINILTEENADIFLSKIQQYVVKTKDLREKVLEVHSVKDNYDCILALSPSLYVNFDKKVLYSLYPEPASYEDYVPAGWTGIYEDFTSGVPENEKYWIIDGNDYLKNS